MRILRNVFQFNAYCLSAVLLVGLAVDGDAEDDDISLALKGCKACDPKPPQPPPPCTATAECSIVFYRDNQKCNRVTGVGAGEGHTWKILNNNENKAVKVTYQIVVTDNAGNRVDVIQWRDVIVPKRKALDIICSGAVSPSLCSNPIYCNPSIPAQCPCDGRGSDPPGGPYVQLQFEPSVITACFWVGASCKD